MISINKIFGSFQTALCRFCANSLICGIKNIEYELSLIYDTINLKVCLNIVQSGNEFVSKPATASNYQILLVWVKN